MKKLSLIMVYALVLATIVALASCKNSSQKNNASSSQEGNHQTTTTSSGVTEKNDTRFEYILLSDGTYGIVKLLDTTLTEIVVPKSYNGKSVTKIMDGAFSVASNMESVMIPSSIQKIEKGAFAGCSSLKDMTLPFIGASASSLDSLGYIFGTSLYAGAQKVNQRFECADGLIRYDNFYIPSGLEKVTVTEGVIQAYSFISCTMIKEIVFGDGVTEIKSDALLLCDGLETVSMGESITEISDECFRYLSNLKNVLIGENVTKIGYYAFDGCVSLKSIVIPKKVVVIEKYAFDDCTGMESIIFEKTTGWYRDYGNTSGTGMDVTNPSVNANNLTNDREYSSDRWIRK